MTVDVRPAIVDDVEEIVEVAEAAWYAAYGGFLDPATIVAAIGEYYDPPLLEAAVEREGIPFYTADDGEVVGFASAERTWADEVELHTIYVHPERWGEGIGSALLNRVVEWADDEGVDRIVCGVFEENAVGVGFFESRGFERGHGSEAEVMGERHPEREFERRI